MTGVYHALHLHISMQSESSWIGAVIVLLLACNVAAVLQIYSKSLSQECNLSLSQCESDTYSRHFTDTGAAFVEAIE